jgi:hypothetical protein
VVAWSEAAVDRSAVVVPWCYGGGGGCWLCLAGCGLFYCGISLDWISSHRAMFSWYSPYVEFYKRRLPSVAPSLSNSYSKFRRNRLIGASVGSSACGSFWLLRVRSSLIQNLKQTSFSL